VSLLCWLLFSSTGRLGIMTNVGVSEKVGLGGTGCFSFPSTGASRGCRRRGLLRFESVVVDNNDDDDDDDDDAFQIHLQVSRKRC
jgi:hypothetical protein